MNYPLAEGNYDIIYSATAFHWLPQEEAYKKITTTLKKGGTLALFWNHPFTSREDDKTNVASCGVYRKYRPKSKKPMEFAKQDCDMKVNSLLQAGFINVESKLYQRMRTLDTNSYLHLLNTYSDHRTLPDNIKEAFETEMRQVLEAAGGYINIYDTIDLYLATKP